MARLCPSGCLSCSVRVKDRSVGDKEIKTGGVATLRVLHHMSRPKTEQKRNERQEMNEDDDGKIRFHQTQTAAPARWLAAKRLLRGRWLSPRGSTKLNILLAFEAINISNSSPALLTHRIVHRADCFVPLTQLLENEQEQWT